MNYDSLVNAGEYLSAHYLAEVFPKDLRRIVLPNWAKLQEEADGPNPRARLRILRRAYLAARADLDGGAPADSRVAAANPEWRERLDALHTAVLSAFGYPPTDGSVNAAGDPAAIPRSLSLEHSGADHEIPVLYADEQVVAVGCGWATEVDAALDREGAGELPQPLILPAGRTVTTGADLASFLFGAQQPPRYVLILAGAVLILADRHGWGEGRYLAVNLDTALGRNDTGHGGELDTVAALFCAESLHSPAEGGENPLATLVDASHRHAVGVSAELRTGLQRSVELIANEVLARLRHAGAQPEQIADPKELASRLTSESLRYLYRILFLLYAEARPDLGILPADYPEYAEGYGLARLGELVIAPMVDESTRNGYHLYESLALLFRLVNDGHRHRRPGGAEGSEDEGIRFEPLHSDLFAPGSISLIGCVEHPGWDPDDAGPPVPWRADTRLRNGCLREVLRLLMLARGRAKERGGFISYAQLSINQVGAVYEGLMSYTGSIATEELYEVAKDGDRSGGSWTIPATAADRYPDEVFVHREDEETGQRVRVRHPAGSFVYRLAGRDRQTSASYYTPESLTKVTVELALRQRLTEHGEVTAREMLDWTICEPALGSGAFLNEAINQVAAEYLRRRETELDKKVDLSQYDTELRKVKAYIALHNSYGVDLNPTAVELAEVSLWLNVMHPGLQAPWFGLHLRRGNSLIGAGRRYYSATEVPQGKWLAGKDSLPPTEHPFRAGVLPAGAVHQFLLPALGWAAVSGEKEARELAPDDTAGLRAWRRSVLQRPKGKQLGRLQGLARRVEYLWQLVVRRLEISQREISRHIDVWGATDLPHPTEAVPRQKVYDDLHAPGTPYWRLRVLMNTWCALWFWPVHGAALLDGTAPDYNTNRPAPPAAPAAPAAPAPVARPARPVSMVGAYQPTLDGEAQPTLDEAVAALPAPTRRAATPRPQRREAVPLAKLDDWIEFAEAVVGSFDIAEGTLSAVGVTSLAELDDLEDQLAALMGADEPDPAALRFPRFPWLTLAEQIADEQGFFHWELDFAHIFASPAAGFDLQLGNPPWVRPRWDADAVLAEHEPWFELEDKPAEAEKQRRRGELLDRARALDYVLGELTDVSAQVTLFGSPQVYPLLSGTQPNLYRAFMCQVWAHTSRTGAAGLLHPDTHFTGDKEGPLREAAYRRLRIHGDFVNSGQRFFPRPVGDTSHFGVHIYGQPGPICFDHLSWLVSVDALRLSRDHDGSGEVPGIRYKNREFDERPHRARVVTVTEEVLAVWQRLLDQEDQPVTQACLLFPVSTAEAEAIAALAAYQLRLAALGPQVSSGFHESGAKRAKLIEYNRPDPTTGKERQPTDWREVILKGIQLGAATPIFKRHNANTNDPYGINLVGLPSDFVLDTAYVQPEGRETAYQAAHDRWIDHIELDRLRADGNAVAVATARIAAGRGIPESSVDSIAVDAALVEESRRPCVDFYRLAWRRLIAPNSERALYAALIPPGVAHIDGIESVGMPDNRLTSLVGGFWASLPIDYYLRSTGRSNLLVAGAKVMPAPERDHPLASALLLRTLRLNCLTTAYADLWAELYNPDWLDEEPWSCEWRGLPPLGKVTSQWRPETPLRTERARRSALVEIDALVAVWLGMDADALVAAYRGRFPVLQKFEAVTWFDAEGWKVAGNARTFGQRQAKASWAQLMAYLNEGGPVPEGYVAPFYKADRVREMREAHAVFSERLARANEVAG
jgi:hypothetical protein